MTYRWQTSNRAELAERPYGFEFGPPVEPEARGWHVMPAVVISTPTPGHPGGSSGASWCAGACPTGGAADAACCRHSEWLELEREARDAKYVNFKKAPATRPGLIQRFKNRKRS